jgi:hypothetical protein
MSKVKVPAGTIKIKEPRPLTEDEKRKVRERVGGDATQDQLADLEAAFRKPERSQDSKPESRDSNGWGR